MPRNFDMYYFPVHGRVYKRPNYGYANGTHGVEQGILLDREDFVGVIVVDYPIYRNHYSVTIIQAPWLLHNRTVDYEMTASELCPHLERFGCVPHLYDNGKRGFRIEGTWNFKKKGSSIFIGSIINDE